MTLIEVMVAAGVLVITSVGGYSGFLLLNRQAANMRNISMARALCQERIEQTLTLPLRPVGKAPTFPTAPSAVPNATPCAILGTSANYSGSAFTGNNLQTSIETIPIYTKSEATDANYGTVTYTRTSTVTPASLNVLAPDGSTGSSSLNVLQFTVAVSWTFRGSSYSTSMTTLRYPDPN